MASGSSTISMRDVEVNVSWYYTPGRPGNYTALPEDSYPDEDDELEIESAEVETSGFVVVDGVRTPATVVVDMFKFLDENGIEELEDLVYQDITNG